jgi:hypothetical protein
VQLEPAFLDRVFEAGAELAALAAERKQEWCINLLDVDAPVLYRLADRSA